MMSIQKLNKKLFFILGAVLVVAIIMVGIVIWMNLGRVNAAFHSKRFEQVQLKVSQSVTYVNPTDTTYDGTSTNSDIYTLIKDGDTVHVSGSFEQYQYVRDGKEYVLVLEDSYGLKEEKEEWVEYLAEDYGGWSFFDFSVFDNYKSWDLKKVEDYYVPKGNVDEAYYNFFQISQKELYENCAMKFYFEKGKLTKIVADCFFDGELNMTWTYEFRYEKETIEIPKADKQYER